MKEIVELGILATRKHYHCEDSYYSCPKSKGGCSNECYDEGECNCGADRHNDKVAELVKKILHL